MSPPSSRPEFRYLTGLFLGATIIAFAPILAVLSARWGELPATTTAFWRVALAFPVLGSLVALRRATYRDVSAEQPPSESRWVLVAPGLLFSLDLTAWHASMAYVSAGLATLIGNLSVIVVPTVAWFWLKERYPRSFFVGAAVALGGTVLLVIPPDRAVQSTLPEGGQNYLLGNLLALSTAFLYGGYQLTIKRARQRNSALTVLFCTVTVATVLLGAVCWVRGARVLPTDARAWWALLALAVVCQCLGQGQVGS